MKLKNLKIKPKSHSRSNKITNPKSKSHSRSNKITNPKSKSHSRSNKITNPKSKTKNTNKSKRLYGGFNDCDEYAFVNESGLDIPASNGVPGLKIPGMRASIGKVKTCPKENHA